MRCLVALGSNLGEGNDILRGAISDLRRLPGTRLLRLSSLRRTPPESPADGGTFLNGVALVETSLAPRALLAALLGIERRWGRRRTPGRKGGPRTLDLDLILYGALRRRSPDLEVPHARFVQRPFVLVPAAEVAPTLRDPRCGRTLRELAVRSIP